MPERRAGRELKEALTGEEFSLARPFASKGTSTVPGNVWPTSCWGTYEKKLQMILTHDPRGDHSAEDSMR
jgi:hypothetical protein